jgi:predicted ArsR family transcriptional regulator
MTAALSALGFQPEAGERDDGGMTFCLGNCPYREAARQNKEVVCTLHRGITRGLLDVIEPGATLDDFVPRDPDEAGCLIDLSPAL